MLEAPRLTLHYMQELLARGANTGMIGHCGQTALVWATRFDRSQVVEVGAVVTSVDSKAFEVG